MKWFIDFQEFPTPRLIGGHSAEPSLAWGTGTVLLHALRPEGRSRMELKDVWFAPTAPYSLLSIVQLEKYGVTFNGLTSSLIERDSNLIITLT